MASARLTVALLTLILALLATSAGAEVLVLRSGESLQIKGPYEVRGARVVYTSLDGDLLSIRSSEIDFEATEERARAATATVSKSDHQGDGADPSQSAEQASGSVAEPASREVVAVITNRDVGTVPPGLRAGGDDPSGATDSPDAGSASASATASASGTGHLLVVSESSDRIGARGYELDGILSNEGNATAVQIRVNATLLDVDGNTIESGTVALEGVRLEPGDTAPFTIAVGSAPAFDRVRFDISSLPLVRRAADTDEPGSSNGVDQSTSNANVSDPQPPPLDR